MKARELMVILSSLDPETLVLKRDMDSCRTYMFRSVQPETLYLWAGGFDYRPRHNSTEVKVLVIE